MYYWKLQIPINSEGWLAVTTHFNCQNVSLRNSDPMRGFLIRTDPESVSTEDQVWAGMQEVISGYSGTDGLRFPAGTVVCWVRSLPGLSDTLIMTCWR